MTKRQRNRLAWGLAAILAGVVLAGVWPLSVRLKLYWVARYRGREADLRGAMLVLAPLRHADLTAADLAGADLGGANLSGAELSEADLTGANLENADLSGAQLSGANLSGARLAGADLSRANLPKVNLEGADLSRARMVGTRLLEVADLKGTRLRRADLTGAKLAGADLSDADLSGANMSRCQCEATILNGADLQGANLSAAELRGASLERANLKGADLTAARLAAWTMLTGAVIDPSTRLAPEWRLVRDLQSADGEDRRSGGASSEAGAAGSRSANDCRSRKHAVPAQSADAEALALWRAIRRCFPGYTLPVREFSPQMTYDRAYGRSIEVATRFVCYGDFDGNRLRDVAMYLIEAGRPHPMRGRRRRRWLFVAFHQTAPGAFRPYVLARRYDPESWRNEYTEALNRVSDDALGLKRRGSLLSYNLRDDNSTGKIRLRYDAIAEWTDDGEAEDVYYFRNGRYRHLEPAGDEGE